MLDLYLDLQFNALKTLVNAHGKGQMALLSILLVKTILLLVSIAYYTIAERKVMAAVQRRRGPNVVGLFGLLQPLTDGLKLIVKEYIVPAHASTRVFIVTPITIFTISLMG